MPSIHNPRDNAEDRTDDYGKSMRRKIKLEAVLTSGCGVGKSKQKIMDAFWNIVWPQLLDLGWTKVEGTGKLTGSTYFVPKGVDWKRGRKGRDFYDRIKAVVDRVLERRNPAETKIADSYDARVVVTEETERDARPKRNNPSRSSNRIDLSWKEGGRNFPKLVSRVGVEYQATDLPSAWTYKEAEEYEETYYDQIWDPAKAASQGTLDYINDSVPPSKKEEAIIQLHNQDYFVEGLLENLGKTCEVDCSEWTKEEKDQFKFEIFRLRKDFTALSQSIHKSMKVCWAYYLRFFKQSDDYRLLKSVIAEERNDRAAGGEHTLDACAICGHGGSLLICDGCEGEYHIACLRPPLRRVPEGNWECDECVDRSFLDARETLIHNATLYKRSEKRRKIAGKKGDDADAKELNEVLLRPASPVLITVRELAKKISEALSSIPIKSK